MKDNLEQTSAKEKSFLDIHNINRSDKTVTLGLCAMRKKLESEPMVALLDLIKEDPYIKFVPFAEEMIIEAPVDEWPVVDAFLCFYSSKFPLEKAEKYVKLRKPFEVNKVSRQRMLWDRTKIYKMLSESAIKTATHVIVRRTASIQNSPPISLRKLILPNRSILGKKDRFEESLVKIRHRGLSGSRKTHQPSTILTISDPRLKEVVEKFESRRNEVKEDSLPGFYTNRSQIPKFFFKDPSIGPDDLEKMRVLEKETMRIVSKKNEKDSEQEHSNEFINPLIEEFDNHILVNGTMVKKPFVEKPIDAEDHDIRIYYPLKEGGGCKMLFRKVANVSSKFDKSMNEVRKSGSFIYEEYLINDGFDIKVYSVGLNYFHAEARKSPTIDGKVRRTEDGKEERFPVNMSIAEKLMAKKVALLFGQMVCGFDIIRSKGTSYVCDVNGWSFVKNNPKYTNDCAFLIRKILHDAFAISAPIPLPILDRHSSKMEEEFAHQFRPSDNDCKPEREEVRSVICIFRHQDRTPKQKVKVEINEPLILNFLAEDPFHEKKLKSAAQLQKVLIALKEVLVAHETEVRDAEIKQELELSQINRRLASKEDLSGLKSELSPTISLHTPEKKYSEDLKHPERFEKVFKTEKAAKGDKSERLDKPEREGIRKISTCVKEANGDLVKADDLRTYHSTSLPRDTKHDHHVHCVSEKNNLTGSQKRGSDTREGHRGEAIKTSLEKISKFRLIIQVLENNGSFSGINRKVQIKPIRHRFDPVLRREVAISALLIMKWGGEITHSGIAQAERLGRTFRHECYPQNKDGLLRLHATYRHDLKVYSSDEGRCQSTAAAFTKGLLEISDDVTPIITSFVITDDHSRYLLDYGKTPSQGTAMIEKTNKNLEESFHCSTPLAESLKGVANETLIEKSRPITNPIKCLNDINGLIRRIVQKLTDLKAYLSSQESSSISGDKRLSGGFKESLPGQKFEKKFSATREEELPDAEEDASRPSPLRMSRGASGKERSLSRPSSVKNGAKANKAGEEGGVKGREGAFRPVSVSICRDESMDLVVKRWSKLFREFYSEKKKQFDLSKITEMIDMINYDMAHNREWFERIGSEPYELNRLLNSVAKFYIMAEYGVNNERKLALSTSVVSPLLRKIRNDLTWWTFDEANKPDEETLYKELCFGGGHQGLRKDMLTGDLISAWRHVRTRLYFTCASHMYTLFNMFTVGKKCRGIYADDERFEKVKSHTMVHYSGYFLIRLLEDLSPEPETSRFRLEVRFCPGLNDMVPSNPSTHERSFNPSIVLNESATLEGFIEFIDANIDKNATKTKK